MNSTSYSQCTEIVGAGEGAWVRYQILGELEVRAGGRFVRLGPREQHVLAVLLVNPGQVVGADRLIDAVWGDDPPDRAEKLLANVVYRLRRSLAPDGQATPVTRGGRGYRIRVADGELDAADFENLSAAAAAEAAAGRLRLAAEKVREALSLWRGPALAGLAGAQIEAAAAGWNERRLAAQISYFTNLLALGRAEEVVAQLAEPVAEHPLHEDLAGLLMVALYRCGRQADALALYNTTRSRLVAQLGVEPGPVLRNTHRRVLAADSDLLAAQCVGSSGGGLVPRGTPHQLPTATWAFTGRVEELSRLTEAARPARAGTVAVRAINGMGGVGKTALALRAAHQLAPQYPDGQLFVDLQGFAEDLPARDPADVLVSFLHALGMPPEHVPRTLDGRAAAYRDRLAGSRTLIVLDNATAERQVRPLLPGAPGCLVLVTSRQRLKALDADVTVALNALTLPECVSLLRRIAGLAPAGTADTDESLEELADLCGRLPLALRIAGALIRHRPSWPVQHLVQRLQTGRNALSGFCDGERDLATVFDLSYRALPYSLRRVFRRLGLVPGPGTEAFATAALLQCDPVQAEQLLQDLVDHNMLAEPAPGRYRMHDLLRAHARALAAAEPPDCGDNDAALDRLLDYYQHTAGCADDLIASSARHRAECPAPQYAPALSDRDDARAWLRAERPNLLAAIRQAHESGRHRTAAALTAGLAALFSIDGPCKQAVELHRAAAAAAAGEEDHVLEANALIDLGAVRQRTGEHRDSLRELRRALQLCRRVEDRVTEARALHGLAIGRGLTGAHRQAIRDHEEALELRRTLGDRRGQATSLAGLSSVRRALGDYIGAIQDAEAALVLFRELADPHGQSYALVNLGSARRECGDFTGGARAFQETLEIARTIGDLNGQATAMTFLGGVRHTLGDLPGAADILRQSLGLFRTLGARSNQAWALNRYALVITDLGDIPRALELYTEALSLARETGMPDDEALALEGLGECRLRSGETEWGADLLHRALDIFRRHDMPEAERVADRLDSLQPSPVAEANTRGMTLPGTAH